MRTDGPAGAPRAAARWATSGQGRGSSNHRDLFSGNWAPPTPSNNSSFSRHNLSFLSLWILKAPALVKIPPSWLNWGSHTGLLGGRGDALCYVWHSHMRLLNSASQPWLCPWHCSLVLCLLIWNDSARACPSSWTSTGPFRQVIKLPAQSTKKHSG